MNILVENRNPQLRSGRIDSVVRGQTEQAPAHGNRFIAGNIVVVVAFPVCAIRQKARPKRNQDRMSSEIMAEICPSKT